MERKENLRIFIAEDDPLVLRGFMVMLEMLGHEVVATAQNGVLAVEAVPAYDPDLILMDINMPELDGISAIERIARKKPYPVILITGYQDEDYIRRGAEAGAYCYLQKPVDEFDLKSAIAVAMARFYDHAHLCSDLDQAKVALEDRKLIDRAKGILMDKFSFGEAQAMKYLQDRSQKKNKKLAAVAKGIVEADSQFNF